MDWGIIFTLTPLVLVLPMFHHFAYIISATVVLPTWVATLHVERYYILVCMATEHNCFVNPYCSHVLSDNLYPIHSI